MLATAIISTILAFAAAVIAGYAAYQTKVSADAVVKQTEIQQQVAIDAAMPYVWADLQPDPVQGGLVHLVVANSGPTVAENIRVTFDHPLPSTDNLEHKADRAQEVLEHGVRSLSPGREIRWPLGVAWKVLKESHDPIRIRVEADGPFGKCAPAEYTVDFSDSDATLARGSGSLYYLTKSTNAISDHLGSLANAIAAIPGRTPTTTSSDQG